MMGPNDYEYYEWAYYEDGERLDWSGNETDEDEFEDDED